jgi:prophage regulatory protein|uniref:AlpA family phage regulatory protein n=1 Tax=Desulfobacca acetoxidans TaxID=60893 RepID=A0A7C3SI69_9BACT
MNKTDPCNDRILRKRTVLALTGISNSTLWRLERQGKFPARRRISPRLVGWLQSDVLNWLNSRPQVEGNQMVEAPKK